MYDDIKVGAFVYSAVYGYGEITTIDEIRQKAFIDFFKGNFDWFSFDVIKRAITILSSDKVYIKVRFRSNLCDNFEDILKLRSVYQIVGLCDEKGSVVTVATSQEIMKREFGSFGT